MAGTLADMSRGFADPVHGAQRTFRTLLDAMAQPGREHELPPAALRGIEPPATAAHGRALGVGTTAALLTLLDAETTVHLCGTLASVATLAYLRFHTGVRPSAIDASGVYTVARGSELDARAWERFALGTDEAPQSGMTLLAEVDELGTGAGGVRLVMQGPGIPSTRTLAVSGLPRAFWAWRIALQAQLPRGIDIVLACGARIAAIPRSTRLQSPD